MTILELAFANAIYIALVAFQTGPIYVMHHTGDMDAFPITFTVPQGFSIRHLPTSSPIGPATGRLHKVFSSERAFGASQDDALIVISTVIDPHGQIAKMVKDNFSSSRWPVTKPMKLNGFTLYAYFVNSPKRPIKAGHAITSFYTVQKWPRHWCMVSLIGHGAEVDISVTGTKRDVVDYAMDLAETVRPLSKLHVTSTKSGY